MKCITFCTSDYFFHIFNLFSSKSVAFIRLFYQKNKNNILPILIPESYKIMKTIFYVKMMSGFDTDVFHAILIRVKIKVFYHCILDIKNILA